MTAPEQRRRVLLMCSAGVVGRSLEKSVLFFRIELCFGKDFELVPR